MYYFCGMYHCSVLLKESVDLLSIDPNGTYVDVTFGGGGHSREILSRLSSRGRLIAFDQDADAMANAPCDKRFTLIHNNFKYLHSCLRAAGCPSVDGILADLGVSSHHFDTPERGFSFRFEGQKLDMRMNQSAERSAENVVNESTIENLAQIFGRYGELDNPFRIAKAIQAARPIADIDALLAAVGGVAPRAAQAKFHAKLFQALRVEVNGEMQALEMMLRGALASLKDGGVLSVIAYHSLEDRMVKNFMRAGNFEGTPSSDLYGRSLAPFTLITRRAVEPSAEERENNPRARSAKLRAARKNDQ
ncbi:MAG: 16S rRNA (cytosine(1402)-N(4))-methyltransferase RsmH [Mucinivorans sp.]